jgi:hypothetical protein
MSINVPGFTVSAVTTPILEALMSCTVAGNSGYLGALSLRADGLYGQLVVRAHNAYIESRAGKLYREQSDKLRGQRSSPLTRV